MASTPPALLLHGQPGSAGDWRWVTEALDGEIPTVALQRPGYDGTPAGGVSHSAEAAVSALDEAGAEQAIVVGHSYGGAIAAWLAAFHPERVAGLVLVSAAANRASLLRGDRWLAAPLIGPLASAGLLWSSGLITRVPVLRRRIAAAAHLPEAFVRAEGRRSLSLTTTRTFLIEQRELLREIPLLEPHLAGITAPSRVILGTRDPVVPPAASRELSRQIPGAELVEIAGGGHVLNVSHPARVAAEILALTRVPR